MEVVRINGEGGIWLRVNVELAPKRVDVFLLVVDASILHHVKANGGVSPICPNQEIEAHFRLCGLIIFMLAGPRLSGVLSMIGLLGMASFLEPRYFCVEVCAYEFVVEVECDVQHPFQSI